MKNNIKAMLLEKANKQTIHDLSDKIISNVDTSKVVIAPIKESRLGIRNISIISSSVVLCACAVAVMAVTLANDDSTTPLDNTSTLTRITSDEQVISTYAQEAYTLANLALSFNDVSYITPELDTITNYMTVSEEEYLVNDLDAYITNIEAMLGLVEISYSCYNNYSIEYAYEYMLNITSPYFEYTFYFNDEVTDVKNEDKPNYKVDSNLTGIIVDGNNVYDVVGSKRIENGSQEFNMQINIGNNYITVREDFSDNNYYRYEYYDNNDNLLKYIDIDQKSNEIDFRNAYDKTVIKLNNDNSIHCKIKSRNSDYLDIVKEDGLYKYTFKNSSNVYIK